MIGALVGALGKPLMKFIAKPLVKVVKFAGKTVFGGLLGKGVVGRLLGGALGKIFGTGLFGGMASLLTSTAKASGLTDDQLAPELSQAASKDKVRYYEKQVANFVPKKGRPKKGEKTNEEKLEELNFNLDQSKKELRLKEESSKERKLTKSGLVDTIGTVLGVLQTIPNLISSTISNLFGSKSSEESSESLNEDDLLESLEFEEDNPEELELTDKKSSMGKTIGGIAGGILGSLFGGPLLGGTAGYFGGEALGGAIDNFIDNRKTGKKKDETVNKETKIVEKPLKLSSNTLSTNVEKNSLSTNVEKNSLSTMNNNTNTKENNRFVETTTTIDASEIAKQVYEEMKNDPRRSSSSAKDRIEFQQEVSQQINERIIIQPTKETVVVRESSPLDKYKSS